MKLSWTLAALFLLQASTGTAAADCDTHRDCLSCVEASCAFTSDAVCTTTCDVTATIDCFSIDNYKGLNGPELCAVAGFEVSATMEPSSEAPEEHEEVDPVDPVPPVEVEEEEEAPSNPDISEIGGSATIGQEEPEEEEECPTGEGMCTMEYEPVMCGECEYSNVCGARLAGFNAEADCALVNAPDAPAAAACPTGEGMCTMEYEPVLCNGECEYSNGCGAELAGFVVATDCALVNAPATEFQGGCPSPVDGMCTFEYEPVLCGEFSCEYPNACIAETAGYNMVDDCDVMNAPGHNVTFPEDHNTTHGGAMQSPCNQLPTCETCLSVRMDCKWTMGACFEDCIADVSCWSPTYQVNMTPPEICELAAQESVVDEAMQDLEVVAGKSVNAAEAAASAAVQQGVWAAVASVGALWVAAAV